MQIAMTSGPLEAVSTPEIKVLRLDWSPLSQLLDKDSVAPL